MSDRQRQVRSAARRATCPLCGRSVAVSYNWDAALWLLRPHLTAPKGRACRGYRVGSDALEAPTPRVVS